MLGTQAGSYITIVMQNITALRELDALDEGTEHDGMEEYSTCVHSTKCVLPVSIDAITVQFYAH